MLIDPGIRDKVLIPLLIVAVVYMSLREVVFKLVLGKPDTAADAEELKQKQMVARSVRLRTNGGYITGRGFAMRKAWFLDAEERGLKTKIVDKVMNPMSQMDAMKGNLVNQAVYMGMWYAVQSSLQGFLLVKLPFSLTERFKQITQAGISISALDTSYVSSGSLFMIALFGLPKVLALFSKNRAQFDESAMMQMQMGMMPGGGAGAPGQPWMGSQQYAAEAKNLAMATHRSALLDAERALLEQATSA